jgi:hypothetical protein
VQQLGGYLRVILSHLGASLTLLGSVLGYLAYISAHLGPLLGLLVSELRPNRIILGYIAAVFGHLGKMLGRRGSSIITSIKIVRNKALP